MKKNVSMLMLSGLTILMVFSLLGSSNVMAVETPDQMIEVQGDTIQTQLQSNVRTMFCFREQTRLTICANIGLELDINCEALRIGDKDVIIEVEGSKNGTMSMTCTREETQLGLMSGSLHRMRNRNTYRYLEGFCIEMRDSANCICECKCDPECTCQCDCECKCNPECTCDCECPNDGAFIKARLRIRETVENRLGQWAYYDNENREWMTVSTINQDGYLTTETSILSTWTLLVPEETTSTFVGIVVIISVFAIGILTISVFYLKKRH